MVQHMNKGDWEKSTFARVCHQTTFHPIFVFGVFVDHHDDIAFFKGQFVLIVRLAVIKGSAFSTHRRKIVGLQNHQKFLVEKIAVNFYSNFLTCLGEGLTFLGRISAPDEERL